MENAIRIREELATGPSPEGPELADEYSYVIADLQRIALLAVAMLAVLIVLALTLP
jgi:hypothetical protein